MGSSDTSRASRAALHEGNPVHIQDAGQRKKAQNRIAQRAYRERIKKRMEALESFRDASIAGHPPIALSDTSSPESNTSKDPERLYFQPMASPAISTPALQNSYGLQDRGNSTKCSTPISPSGRDEGHATPFQAHREHTTATVTPSLDTIFSFKPHSDQSSHGMWDLNQAINIGRDVEDINRSRDAEYRNTPEWPSSHLMKEFARDLSLDDQSQDGKTALHIAAENGKTSTVQMLLSLRPDTLAQDAMGRTALHLAVRNEHEDVIQELVKNSICLEVQDQGGQTALHSAAANGYDRAVACLVAAGADLECKDSRGQSALHLAAANGWDNILQLLFNGGADINAKMKT